MKKRKIFIYFSILLIIPLLTTACGKEIDVKNGSKVAVSIKGNKYTATEYYEEIKKDNIVKLIDMIDKNLFEKKYKTDSEETEYIDNQINQMKSYYGNENESFKTVIKQYFGVKSEEELRDMLSLNYKRNKAVEDYIIKNLKSSEIQKYYDEKVTGQMKASHILITSDAKEDATTEEKEKADKKALEKAQKIIKQLDEGKKFETLAKKNSQDKSNASNGGDLGYFDLDSMVEDFSNAVKELKVDEYTKEPVKTEYGYHIILKTGEKKKPKLSKVKKDIKEKLKDQKLKDDPTIQYKTLKNIREENKIKWNDDVLKKAYNDYIDDQINSSTAS